MALLRVLFHRGRAPLVLFVVVAHLVWHRGLVPFVARSVAWLAMVVDSKVTERQKDPSAAQVCALVAQSRLMHLRPVVGRCSQDLWGQTSRSGRRSLLRH